MPPSQVSIRALLSEGHLKPGQQLLANHRGHRYTAKVKDDGHILVDGGGTFRSPSLAANSITHRNTNGWLFWAVDLGDRIEPLAVLRDQATAGLEARAADEESIPRPS